MTAARILSRVSTQARAIREELKSFWETEDVATLSPDGRDVKELLKKSIDDFRSSIVAKSGKFTHLCQNIERLRPIMMMFVPQSSEYMVPFACVFLIFKVRYHLAAFK